jgi:hypothetical protein
VRGRLHGDLTGLSAPTAALPGCRLDRRLGVRFAPPPVEYHARADTADRLGVGGRAVPAHHLHAGARAEPRFQGVGPLPGRTSARSRGCTSINTVVQVTAPAQRDVSHPQHARHRLGWQRQTHY